MLSYFKLNMERCIPKLISCTSIVILKSQEGTMNTQPESLTSFVETTHYNLIWKRIILLDYKFEAMCVDFHIHIQPISFPQPLPFIIIFSDPLGSFLIHFFLLWDFNISLFVNCQQSRFQSSTSIFFFTFPYSSYDSSYLCNFFSFLFL